MNKKIDILGRELQENDIVITSYKNKMHIGVVIKNKIRINANINHATTSKNIYKVLDPSMTEINEKFKILKKYEKLLKNKKEEKKIREKANGPKEYAKKIGEVCRDGYDIPYIYLGNLILTKYDECNNIISRKKGHCYNIFYSDDSAEDIFSTVSTVTYYLSFLKGYKRTYKREYVSKELNNINNIIGTYSYQRNIFNHKTNTWTTEIGKIVVEENIEK